MHDVDRCASRLGHRHGPLRGRDLGRDRTRVGEMRQRAATFRDEVLGGALHDCSVLAVHHHEHPGVQRRAHGRDEAGDSLLERRAHHEHFDGGLACGGQRLQRVGGGAGGVGDDGMEDDVGDRL